MADPLSITAGVVGILGFALHGAKRLAEFIDSLRGAPEDIATLSTDLKALYGVLEVLTRMQDELGRNASLYEYLRGPLENCMDIFEEFTMTLHTYTLTTREGAVKVRKWKSIAWAFKDKEIQLFRDTLVTYKASLDLAVGALMLSTTASIDDRTRRMEHNFEEELKHIRVKLQALDTDRIELASVSGRKGSEWHGTDTGFALGRFLDYAGSLCDSPPSSLPGSPIIPPSHTARSDPDTEIETLYSVTRLDAEDISINTPGSVPVDEAAKSRAGPGMGEQEHSHHEHTAVNSYGAGFPSTSQPLPQTTTIGAPATSPPPEIGTVTHNILDDRSKNLVFDFLPVHVFTAKPQTGEITWVNSRYLSYRGYTLADLTENPGSDIHPDDRGSYLEAWGQFLQSGGSVSRHVRVRRFDGEYRWMYVRAVTYRDKNGVTCNILGSYTDAHDQIIAEIKVAARDQMEIRASQARPVSESHE